MKYYQVGDDGVTYEKDTTDMKETNEPRDNCSYIGSFAPHAGSPSLVEPPDPASRRGGVGTGASFAEESDDAVNHPAHYKASNGVEAIQAIEAATEGLQGFEGYCTGNSVKYLMRWKEKGGAQDLQKSRWYINRLLAHLGVE